MKLFGFTITREKGIAQSVPSPRGWYRILEPFTGAWQRNIELSHDCQLASSAVYACATRIANDIAKMPLNLAERDANGIWTTVERNSPFWPVLRKPNGWQNRIQFFTCWMLSKLLTGNAYVLLERDGRGIVVAMYVLDPSRVQVMVSTSGAVFYSLNQDNLAGLEQAQVNVPASEVIHDLMNPLFHPLCGVSPLFACGLSASQANQIQRQSAAFFGNASTPSGILVAPGDLTDTQATQWAAAWKEKFSGANAGNVAVLGNGLKYEKIATTAQDAQLIEQLKWTVEDVARAFGVPLYKIAAGQTPISNNVEALNLQYYSDTLQVQIEAIELCLDEGFGLGIEGETRNMGVEFDLDVLLRMDSMSQLEMLSKGVGAAIYSPNEARARRNLPPVDGGESPMIQQQNYSLEALARRDAGDDPFGTAVPAANDDDAKAAYALSVRKGLGLC